MRRIATLAAVAGAVLLVSTGLRAETNFNVGVKLSHDSNVNGSPTARQGDFYLTGHASAVHFRPINDERTRYFIGQVGVMASKYDRYSSADSTSLLASVGLWQQLDETWSGQGTLRVFRRDTRQHDRDSDGYGATLELKKQLAEKWWVKGFADFEHSTANLGAFSYQGPTFGLGIGYLPRADTFVNLGYNLTDRDFKSIIPFETRTQLLYAELTERLRKDLYLSVGYAHGRNRSNVPGTNYSHHIWSVGLSVSY